MRPANFLPRPELLLTSLASVSLFGAVVYAADETDSDSAKSTDSSDESTSAADSATKTSDDSSKTTATEKDSTSTTEKADSTTAEASSTTEAADTTTADDSSSTEDSDSSTTDISSTISSISSASDTESTLSDMPTLTDTTSIPTYPAPSVPPTSNAPFMQHSNAPDGTVFIAVGAILGAIGIAILLWRVIIGILLHRSVERAAKAQHDANTKTGFPAPPAPFYKYTDNASNMSLAAGRGVRRTTRASNVLSATPSASNLFFSPTAAASGGGTGNRGSAFLPSGFYAAGTSSPGGNNDHSISLTNLRPDSRGQYGNPSRNTLSVTPPDSPSFNSRRDVSNTSLNLNRPPSQRAPSAFLDDLLADDPSALPPPHMPGSQRHSSYGSGPGSQNRF